MDLIALRLYAILLSFGFLNRKTLGSVESLKNSSNSEIRFVVEFTIERCKTLVSSNGSIILYGNEWMCLAPKFPSDWKPLIAFEIEELLSKPTRYLASFSLFVW